MPRTRIHWKSFVMKRKLHWIVLSTVIDGAFVVTGGDKVFKAYLYNNKVSGSLAAYYAIYSKYLFTRAVIEFLHTSP